MYLVIAEKPSVSQAIGKVIGAYFGAAFRVSYAFSVLCFLSYGRRNETKKIKSLLDRYAKAALADAERQELETLAGKAEQFLEEDDLSAEMVEDMVKEVRVYDSKRIEVELNHVDMVEKFAAEGDENAEDAKSMENVPEGVPD